MMPLYLLKITAPETPKSDEKKPAEKPTAQAVELLAKGADVAPAKILSSKATELTVDFDESLLNDGKEFLRFNFQGKLKTGVILGNISFNGGKLYSCPFATNH